MAEQLPLFAPPESRWEERLHEKLTPKIRDQLKAILVEMARAALTPVPDPAQEGDRNEP